ncbi:hypothetical protein MAHJHV54_27110 [Mycobacterium avium subsp. hominissuis]|nr:hypothetical protein O971_08195 [Mycobacterium avium subsp. hominissuis 10-4249]ETB48775.1 hypothetical protein O974_07350 [Mycobacterium avium 11-0986]KDO97083.1 hypothetical protein MAVA5_07705 [Mycobacterium avium subsp. hominissuis A5]
MEECCQRLQRRKETSAMNAAAEYDTVKEGLLIEGLQDWISLSNVHSSFLAPIGPARPLEKVQQLTLNMIRDLVSEGLFILGSAAGTKQTPHFEPWDLPLEAAMAKIEEAYVRNFDDTWGWRTMCWLNLTDKGEKLALERYHAD